MSTVITPQAPVGTSEDSERLRPALVGTEMIQVRPAAPADEAAVCAMVTRCSPTSLYRRFHGFTDAVAYTRTLFAAGPIDRMLLAWDHSLCVGMAGLVADDEGIGHLGVLVEDAWQGRRVGSRLVAALLKGARARGESRVRAIVLGESEFLVAALHRAGPVELSVTLGTYSIEVDLVGTGV